MSIEKITSNLQQFYDKEKILIETFKQIKKDLAHLYSLDKEWNPEAYNFITLKEFLKPLFNDLLQHHPKDLVQSFYRMDLSENEVGQCLEGNDQNVITDRITIAVINRELKKVIIRLYYSDKL